MINEVPPAAAPTAQRCASYTLYKIFLIIGVVFATLGLLFLVSLRPGAGSEMSSSFFKIRHVATSFGASLSMEPQHLSIILTIWGFIWILGAIAGFATNNRSAI